MDKSDIVREQIFNLIGIDDPLKVEERLKHLADTYEFGIKTVREEYNVMRREVRAREELVNQSDLNSSEIVIKGQTFVVPGKFALRGGIIQEGMQGYKGEVYWVPTVNAIIIPIKRILNIDNNEHSVELLVRRNGRDKTITCGHEVISNSSLLVSKLSPKGIPVNTINAKKVICFLDEFIHVNFHSLEYAFTSGRAGWIYHDNLSLFNFGDTIIAPRNFEHNFQKDNSKEQVRQEFKSKGVREEWIKAVALSLPYDIPLFLIAASLAAPLLSIFKASSFTVNAEGNSTTGKTTATDVALSFWGGPSMMKSTWNATLAGMETHLAEMNCLVTNLDDASQARSLEHIKRVLYLIGNEKGATRSDENLKKRETVKFSVVLLSSSESSLLTTSSLQGEAARLIEFNDLPWNEKSSEAAALTSQIGSIIQNNNGFYGLEYLQYLVDAVNDEQQLILLKDRYSSILQTLSTQSVNPYTLRMMPALSCCCLALEILRQLIPELGLESQRIADLFKFVITNRDLKLADFKDLPLRAYTYVWQKILSSPGKFERNEHEIWGAYITRGEESGFAFLQDSLRKILEEGSFSFGSCSKYFKENKYVWLDKQGELHVGNINGTSSRVFVFSKDIAIKLGVLEDTQEVGLQDYKVTRPDGLL